MIYIYTSTFQQVGGRKRPWDVSLCVTLDIICVCLVTENKGSE